MLRTLVIGCVLALATCFHYYTRRVPARAWVQTPRRTIHAVDAEDMSSKLYMKQVLFVETGFGADQHGQNATKAAIRACRNAIEFNSIPCIGAIVPGGKENMLLRVQIAVPDPETVSLDAVREVFPYGQILPIEISEGGMRASSGIAIPELGDKDDSMLIAIACVTVGY